MHVVRASKIGHPCIRNIWYSSVGGIEEDFTKETLRIFEVGTILEKVVVGWLREDGWGSGITTRVAKRPNGRLPWKSMAV
jgi:hypothetical protein